MKRSLLTTLLSLATIVLFTSSSISDNYDIIADGGSTASHDLIGHVLVADANAGADLEITMTLDNTHSDPLVITKDLPGGPPYQSQLRNLRITGVHVHVDDINLPNWPTKVLKNGNPRPGQFEYRDSKVPCSPPSARPLLTPCDLSYGANAQSAQLTIAHEMNVAIAIHLEISGELYYNVVEPPSEDWVQAPDPGTGSDTAWVASYQSPTVWNYPFIISSLGSNWAYYITHGFHAAPGVIRPLTATWGQLKSH